jgi:NAD(P) transhydrogenase subunit beta
VLIVGANDVCNPAARDPKSVIAGMPILDVDKARRTIVMKRSLSPGFAGIDNDLFYNDNNLMFFGDAKQSMADLVKAVRELA